MPEILGANKKAYLIIHTATLDDSGNVNSADIVSKTDAVLTAAALLGSAGNSVKDMALKLLNARVLEVQYNPTSLSLQANANSIPFSSLQQNVDNNVPNQNMRPPQVLLSVDLFFDAMDKNDAFMAEKFNPKLMSAGKNVASAILKRKQAFTVQPQTNGLLATLLRPQTRLVTFRWADMVFTGIVTEASAEYTMFSISGMPIRSRVRLNITQTVNSNGDLKYWDAAIDRVFKSENDISLRGAGQKTGNLLNLNAF